MQHYFHIYKKKLIEIGLLLYYEIYCSMENYLNTFEFAEVPFNLLFSFDAKLIWNLYCNDLCFFYVYMHKNTQLLID